MRIRFAGTLALTALLAAAAPAPKPVITLDGVATAVKLDAAGRTAISKQIAGLNAGLVKIVAIHKSYDTATGPQHDDLLREMKIIHTHCMIRHEEILKTLDPEQRTAYFAYLHAQMKAAGIDMAQFQHEMMDSDSMHNHAAMAGAGHGG